MHKVYENNDLMMYFKKRYCHCCGNILQRKKTERIVHKGDPEHSIYCNIGTSYKPYRDILVIGKEYYCRFCDKPFSCDEQTNVIETQKHYKRNIVTEEEINDVKNNNMLIANSNILKMRWLLLIPVIGWLICTFKIFNGCLSEKTKHKDLHTLTLVSVILFIAVALATKLVLGVINNNFTNAYKTILILIPSLFLFNIPTLWYINRLFRNN